ncbi:hypothetical protein T265_02359 [Opisthorchis viverrini]|uniref:Uncharacterized protein n=1 Tax=Opisthorchis viverrini TaxID=6198 RepID=A0A074ZWD5_OPIVI|nr:hypothetical protein T265_02359 [Opisthorchis viverrini]KER31451.1 hypothetical protein T265_02359 [Opisthorchis viverrini]
MAYAYQPLEVGTVSYVLHNLRNSATKEYISIDESWTGIYSFKLELVIRQSLRCVLNCAALNAFLEEVVSQPEFLRLAIHRQEPILQITFVRYRLCEPSWSDNSISVQAAEQVRVVLSESNKRSFFKSDDIIRRQPDDPTNQGDQASCIHSCEGCNNSCAEETSRRLSVFQRAKDESPDENFLHLYNLSKRFIIPVPSAILESTLLPLASEAIKATEKLTFIASRSEHTSLKRQMYLLAFHHRRLLCTQRLISVINGHSLDIASLVR